MKRILVVEDNEKNMYLISFILKKNNYEVIEARNGKDGVKLAIKEKPDLIIMDIQLPDVDGMEATKKIKESEEAGNIPIIAFTSYAMAGDREKALSAGFVEYIEKPINLKAFIADIEKHL